ncbi:MAG TPA: hypothetical protein VHF58_09210 [Solirubrobacterales bacterium]|nr:hypothetical protein [Solirubrobacterales bacterium]
MVRSLHPRLALAVVIAAVALVGAGALALASTGSGDDGVFEIELAEGSIGVEDATVGAGRQVVEVKNSGTEEHEVAVVRTDRPIDGIPVGLHGVSASLAGELVIGEDHVAARHAHRPDELLGLAPGTSRRYQLDLAPGRYVVLCQTDNHYLEGERTEFEVR